MELGRWSWEERVDWFGWSARNGTERGGFFDLVGVTLGFLWICTQALMGLHRVPGKDLGGICIDGCEIYMQKQSLS